jgi:GxxExxY protein
MIHQELSRSIIGSAMDVLNELKPGLDEKLYERAMAIELRRRVTTSSCKLHFLYSIEASQSATWFQT